MNWLDEDLQKHVIKTNNAFPHFLPETEWSIGSEMFGRSILYIYSAPVILQHKLYVLNILDRLKMMVCLPSGDATVKDLSKVHAF